MCEHHGQVLSDFAATFAPDESTAPFCLNSAKQEVVSAALSASSAFIRVFRFQNNVPFAFSAIPFNSGNAATSGSGTFTFVPTTFALS